MKIGSDMSYHCSLSLFRDLPRDQGTDSQSSDHCWYIIEVFSSLLLCLLTEDKSSHWSSPQLWVFSLRFSVCSTDLGFLDSTQKWRLYNVKVLVSLSVCVCVWVCVVCVNACVRAHMSVCMCGIRASACVTVFACMCHRVCMCLRQKHRPRDINHHSWQHVWNIKPANLA